jgi:hypothetical protein
MPPRRLNPLSFLARYWFPLALLVLMVLASPGLVLFVLHVLGRETETNAWLDSNLRLDYHLALSSPVALLLLLTLPALIVLYFLKLKRKPLQVPSTFLWRKSIEDLHVNSLFQWLRENALLLLQLLVLLVLIYAVLGLRFQGATSRGRHYIVMIDNSASMAVRDANGLSRLEWARQEALKEIEASTDSDKGMVIVFNAQAATLQPFTTNRALLRQAVQGITQTQRPTRIEEAITLADSRANPLRSADDLASQPDEVEPGKERTYVPPKGFVTEVHLYSDGRFADLSEAALANLNSRLAGNASALGNLKLHFHSAGTTGPEKVDNVGIFALNAASVGGAVRREGDPAKVQVFVRVRNYRPHEARVTLCLDLYVQGERQHVDQQVLELKPRRVTEAEDLPGESAAFFNLPPLDLRSNSLVHVYLNRHKDQFELDDQAWINLGVVRKARVLLAGPANRLLDAFFDQEATKQVAVVERLAPAELHNESYRKAARSGEFDLVIYDRCAPAARDEMPYANTFFIDRLPPPWRREKAVLKSPRVMVAQKSHPLLRHLTTLWDVDVTEAFTFDLTAQLPKGEVPPTMTRLLEASGNVPVLFTLGRSAFTDLVFTSPLLNDKGDLTTNWPLQPSFPLFLRNLLYQLGNVRDTVGGQTAQPGEPVALRPVAGATNIEVISPDGKKQTLKRGTRPDFTYADTDQVGHYRVHSEKIEERHFTVNLLDPIESNIEPRREVLVAGTTVRSDEVRRQPHELWKWIVLAGLVLLLLEWYVYNRRVYV